jgi:hypothetical protein
MGTRRNFERARGRDRAVRSARDGQADEQALYRMGARGPCTGKRIIREVHCPCGHAAFVPMPARPPVHLRCTRCNRRLTLT